MNNVRRHTVHDYHSSNGQKLLENADLVDWNSFKKPGVDENHI